MKRFHNFSLLPLALAAVLAGCSHADDDAVDHAGSHGLPVLLSASSAQVAQAGATRAADGQYTAATGFNGGEKVAVFMEGGTTASAVYDVGAPDDAKKSLLSVSSGQTGLEYPVSGDVKIYAVYPSTSTTSHVVRHDQTSTTDGNARYRQSDLMYASAVTVTPSQQGTQQELAFTHQLAKLKVVVKKGLDVGQVTAVTLGNVQRKCGVTVSANGITLGTATAAVSGDDDYSPTAATNNSILMGAVEDASDDPETYTYCCVLPAQSWTPQNPGTVTVTADGRDATYLITTPLTYGQESVFRLWEHEDAGKAGLTKAQADTLMGTVWNEWIEQTRQATSAVFNSTVYSSFNENMSTDEQFENRITIGGRTMKIWWMINLNSSFTGELGIFIALHGGGSVGASSNNREWNNMTKLYRPDNVIYVCPRGIEDVWNLHFTGYTGDFYAYIIRMFTAWLNVDPNKVYIMGYSAGGDGVWALAPRFPDWWAAATMCAGHPNKTGADLRNHLLSLRNTPYGIWCGENDNSYNRAAVNRSGIDYMTELHTEDPGGYICDGHIVPDKGHWMDGAEQAALPWMTAKSRNPYPSRVVWRMHPDNANNDHKYWLYWVGVPADEAASGKEVIANYSGQTVTIEKSDYTNLTIYLNDTMMDLDKPVTVMYGGEKVFEGRLKRLETTIRETMFARNDKYYMFPTKIHISLNQ